MSSEAVALVREIIGRPTLARISPLALSITNDRRRQLGTEALGALAREILQAWPASAHQG